MIRFRTCAWEASFRPQILDLCVELGKAQGHNWFCVLYPALCVSGATAEYPTEAENALVFGKYEVRFALLDALQGR